MNNSALMIWSVLFGAIGLGFFTYGSRQKAIVHEPGEWELDITGDRRPELYGELTAPD